MIEATCSFETSVCCYHTTWRHVPEVTAMRTGNLPWFLTYVMKFDCDTKCGPVEWRKWHYELTFILNLTLLCLTHRGEEQGEQENREIRILLKSVHRLQI